MGNIQKYIDSITVPNTEKVARFVLGGVETDIDHYDKSQLEHFILEQRPSSPKAITTICYVLGAYAKWLQDEGFGGEKLLFETRSLNKDELWKKAKPSASKKYLSHTDFLRIIRDPETDYHGQKGRLACLRLDDGKVFYSVEEGQSENFRHK